ncbi:hypothetical protein [Psychroflexus montanilacus]|uniref:hypothetical protein n=1 Tax=Psychroflexus montanilacus TaxID=2873598 RepID=UPI001CCEC8A0|nr:hypothetical protein [Psychroflexus montanilacus]MBZ9652838.1 hypothetical protein [Psychroflexus montanilacus]
MSKTTKIYIVFILIFLVGFLAIYLYIRFFLNQQLTTVESEVEKPLSALLALL